MTEPQNQNEEKKEIKKEEKKGLFKKNCKDCEKYKKEAEENKNNWLRALADYKNLQRETQERRSEWAKLSEEQVLNEFIPVYDHLKMVVNSEGLADKKDPWLEGVRYIAKQFNTILQSHGVEEVKTVGEKFDPVCHEAVSEEAKEVVEPGIIIKELSSGYKMGGKVIKVAKVVISK